MTDSSKLADEVQRLRQRESDAAEILEWWFNLANNVVGAPNNETLDWLSGMKPYPEEEL